MTTTKILRGQTCIIRTAAPASAQFIGRKITITTILPNAILGDIEGHGPAFIHRAWGTKRNPGDLVLEAV